MEIFDNDKMQKVTLVVTTKVGDDELVKSPIVIVYPPLTQNEPFYWFIY